MKKEIIRGLIIGLVLCSILIIVAFVSYSLQQKTIKRMTKEFSREELIKMWEQTAKQRETQACKQALAKLKEETECLKFKNEARDVCYYCFALEKNDLTICQKISKKTWKERCKKKDNQR